MNEFDSISCSILSSTQKEEALQLWNESYPTTLSLSSVDDLEDYLSGLGNPKHSLLFRENKLEAWFWDFDREGEKWFAMMVSKAYRGRGLGARMLIDALERNPKIVGWVIDKPGYEHADGSPYKSPLAFYEKYGFKTLNQRLELPSISAVKIARFFT